MSLHADSAKISSLVFFNVQSPTDRVKIMCNLCSTVFWEGEDVDSVLGGFDWLGTAVVHIHDKHPKELL